MTAGGQRLALPGWLGTRAAEVAEGRRAVAQPRDAATVVLVRPGEDGIEVLLLCRARAMDFAPGAHVFPGGSVDPLDTNPDIGWAGPSPQELSPVLGVQPERCLALMCAAVRETFEEAGVLLGAGQPAEQDRRELLAGSASLAEVLSRRELVLHADFLTPWARWITPEAADRRFDTWFFVAAMPAGQVADAGIGAAAEADSAAWLAPGAALAAARGGEITLLPPTAVTLAELAAHSSVGEILAQRRMITTRMPSVVVEDGRAWLAMPDGVEYPL